MPYPKKVKCKHCKTTKEVFESCQICKKDIKRKAGLLNLYVQSPTDQYANGQGRYWREWSKLRLCPQCYRKTVKKLKEIFFIASSK